MHEDQEGGHTQEQMDNMQEAIDDMLAAILEALDTKEVCHECLSFAAVKALTATLVDLDLQSPAVMMLAVSQGVELAMDVKAEKEGVLHSMETKGSC